MTITDLRTALRAGLATLERFDSRRTRVVTPAIGGGELGRLFPTWLVDQARDGRLRAWLVVLKRPRGNPSSHLHLLVVP